MDINKVTVLVFVSMLISACAGYGEKDVSPLTQELIACKEPRPQICTQEYNPVCATYKNGSKKTGSTACTACSDSKVLGYTKRACETVAVE